MSQQILFICHRIPAPPNKGDKIRSFNFIRKLAKKNEVHLAFLIDNKDDVKSLDMLKGLAANIFYDIISPGKKKIMSAVTALLGAQPVTIPYFYSKDLQAKIDGFLDNHPIDRVFCFSSPTAEYLYRSRHRHGLLKNIPWIMDLIDVDSHKWRQYAGDTVQPMRWLYGREARLLLKYEERIARDFQYLFLVSEAEKQLFSQFVSTSNTRAVGNGVDLTYFAPGQGRNLQHTRPALVFTGAMDYWPNIDGVTWFAESIFPLIQQKVPDVQFYIVGSNPTANVSKLAEVKGVHVTGFVEDVRDYLASADICVIPLRIARGIQNKVLEAMAMGKPVVCSAGALEGIEAEPGKELVTARENVEFADAVTALLRDRSRQESLGRQARICMEQKYAWSAVLEKLDHLLSGEAGEI